MDIPAKTQHHNNIENDKYDIHILTTFISINMVKLYMFHTVLQVFYLAYTFQIYFLAYTLA